MKLSELQIESLMWWDDEKQNRVMPEHYFACLFFSKFITCEKLDCLLTDEGLEALEQMREMDWEDLYGLVH